MNRKGMMACSKCLLYTYNNRIMCMVTICGNRVLMAEKIKRVIHTHTERRKRNCSHKHTHSFYTIFLFVFLSFSSFRLRSFVPIHLSFIRATLHPTFSSFFSSHFFDISKTCTTWIDEEEKNEKWAQCEKHTECGIHGRKKYAHKEFRRR